MVGYVCVRRGVARRNWSRGTGQSVCPEPRIPGRVPEPCAAPWSI